MNNRLQLSSLHTPDQRPMSDGVNVRNNEHQGQFMDTHASLPADSVIRLVARTGPPEAPEPVKIANAPGDLRAVTLDEIRVIARESGKSLVAFVRRKVREATRRYRERKKHD